MGTCPWGHGPLLNCTTQNRIIVVAELRAWLGGCTLRVYSLNPPPFYGVGSLKDRIYASENQGPVSAHTQRPTGRILFSCSWNWALRAYRSWLPGRGCSTRVHSRNPIQVLSTAQSLQLPHTKKWANLERSHLLKQGKNHPEVGLFSVSAEKSKWIFWPT